MKKYELFLGQIEEALANVKINIARMQDDTLSPYDKVSSGSIAKRDLHQIEEMSAKLNLLLMTGSHALKEEVSFTIATEEGKEV